MARYILGRSEPSLRRKKPNSIQVLVIGRDFPGSRGVMHPVAQFNITYAYSIVSQRRRRNWKGLCTLARLAWDAPEGQKLALLSNFLRLLWKFSDATKFPASHIAWRLRYDLPRICRDMDFRPNLWHLCLTQYALADALRLAGIQDSEADWSYWLRLLGTKLIIAKSNFNYRNVVSWWKILTFVARIINLYY